MSGLPEIELQHLLDPLDHLFAELPALAELAAAHPGTPMPFTVEARMPAPITDELRALLAAVLDALAVPLPGLNDTDELAHRRILTDRTDAARIAIVGILHRGHDIVPATDYLTKRTAQVPITYATFKPAEQAQRCGRCRWTFDPSDTRFDGHARHRDTPWCRRCIDTCRDGGAEHVCPICDPARYGHKQDGGRP